jgi:acetolactate synthase-1/2/3 large subunit
LDVPNRPDRLARIDGWQIAKAEVRTRLDKPLKAAVASSPVHPGLVPAIAQEVMPEDTVWIFDGGNTVVWSNFHHEARVPRSILSTYKFGMLGAGFGQALGAAVAAPDRRVCCLIGDGAFGMHASEIESAVRLGLPIVFVVFVDGQWGMVKMTQQFQAAPLATVARKMILNAALPDDQIVYADFEACRYDQLATALGAHGEYVTSATDLRAALERARDCGGPAVVHVQVNNVEHMWAPGLQAFKKMHQEPKG